MVVASILYPEHRKQSKNSFRSCTFKFLLPGAGVSRLRGRGFSAVTRASVRTTLLIGIDDASMCLFAVWLLLVSVDNDAGVAPPVKLVPNEIILLPATSDNISLCFRLIWNQARGNSMQWSGTIGNLLMQV